MGLLGYIYSRGDAAKRAVRGLLADPIGSLQQTAGQITDDAKSMNARNARMIADPASITPQDTQAVMGLLGPAPMGITVWHGSPHKFTKFDMSKIGTGEGAQAYGHGLYMAETPDVAKTYADTLGEEVLVKGKPVYKAHNNTIAGDAPIGNAARNALQGSNWDLSKAKAAMQDAYKTSGDGYFKRAFDELSALSESDITRKTGAMYKVDIPDEAVARFLDWDKPLSQQPIGSGLQVSKNESPAFSDEKWLVNIGDRTINAYRTKKEATSALTGLTGADLYRHLDAAGAAPGVEYLQSQGITGIRYLDGGSRSAGQGSSNFVLFDDQMPRILEINGQPTGQVPWKPGEFGGLLNQ